MRENLGSGDTKDMAQITRRKYRVYSEETNRTLCVIEATSEITALHTASTMPRPARIVQNLGGRPAAISGVPADPMIYRAEEV